MTQTMSDESVVLSASDTVCIVLSKASVNRTQKLSIGFDMLLYRRTHSTRHGCCPQASAALRPAHKGKRRRRRRKR